MFFLSLQAFASMAHLFMYGSPSVPHTGAISVVQDLQPPTTPIINTKFSPMKMAVHAKKLSVCRVV